MSGFFSLGSGSKDQDHQQQQTDTNNNNNTSSSFLFKNEEICNKGFELWQQYQRVQQNHHQTTFQDVGFLAGSSSNIGRNNNSIIFGSNIGDDSTSYSTYRSASGFIRMAARQGRGANEGINCQDCGNQAKKDCTHMRCRTCCKSRGLPCQTHVKSTWVPAAKRRERQQQVAAMQQELAMRGENTKRLRENSGGGGGGGSSGAGGGSCNILASATRLPLTTSGFDLGQFPPEVNSPAVFRCVKVSAMDDAEEQFAYQTAVNIGGHVFKGILYDQGLESRYPGGGGESSSDCRVSQQPLDFIPAAASTTMAPATATTSHHNVAMLDPSIYPAPLSAFMAGTQFFPPPRP